MHIDYSNMPNGISKTNFIIRYIFNLMRSWYIFHFKYPWVKYNGFVRVMKGTSFALNMDIKICNNVQFGEFCNIACNIHFGSNILIASRVCFIGRHDHSFSTPGKTIWEGERESNEITIIEDDVWIGTNSIILSGITIGKGSIVAAGSIVTKNIPPCEIWGGNPAKKIKERFSNEKEKEFHLLKLKEYSI
jgi:chloramphenicol O-acetyltransferase type B